MQQLIKKIVYSGLLSLIMFGMVNFALAAECTGGGASCALSGLEETNNTKGVKLPGGATAELNENWITGRVGSLIGNVLAFVGVIFLALIIYAGYLWMTAGGDAAKTTKAIGIMTDAVVGLIVIGSAYLLTQYVGTVVLSDFTT